MHTIQLWLQQQGMAIIRFVDISRLPPAQTLGFPRAVLFGLPLSRAFIQAMHSAQPCGDEYLQAEQQVEALADRLAERLQQQGFAACSQSERHNMASGRLEGGYIDPVLRTGPSPVPQKTLGRLAGLGFVGRNNLLVTQAFGCAVALCSVLTDAPLPTCNTPPPPSGCGGCRRCVAACPTGALSGRAWTRQGGREALLDRAKCACPLACMMACPHTLRYAGIAVPAP